MMPSPLIRSICTLVLVCLLGGLVPPFDPVAAALTAGSPRTLSLNHPLPAPTSIPSLAPAAAPIDEAALEQHHTPVAAPVAPVANVAWESATTTFNSPPTWWSLPHVVLGPEENLHAVFLDGPSDEEGQYLYYTTGELSEAAPRVAIAEGLANEMGDRQPRIALDDGGGVHVVWFVVDTIGRSYLSYRYCAGNCLSEANWQEPYALPSGVGGSGGCPPNPAKASLVAWGSGATRQVALAAQGSSRISVIGCTGDECNQREWRGAINMGAIAAEYPTLALGPADENNERTVHLLYHDTASRLIYAAFADDTWSDDMVLASHAFLFDRSGSERYAIKDTGITVDSEGVVSVGWPEEVGETHMPLYRRCKGACDTAEQWSQVAVIGDGRSTPALREKLITATGLVSHTASVDGYVGMRIRTDDTPLQLGGLGRYTDDGDEIHDLQVVRASDGQTLTQTSLDLTIETVGPGEKSAVSADGFAYADIPQPIVLAPNTSYDIITSVTAGGDPYYRAAVTPLEGVQVTGTVEGATPDALTFTEAPGAALGPVSLLFASASDGTPINPPVSEGLYGWYFAGINLNRPMYGRTDPVIDFAWDESPVPGIVPADNFSVRWQGLVRTEETGDYTFGLNVAGGVRVWFGDELVVDAWDDGSERTVTWRSNVRFTTYRTITIDYQAVSGAEAVELTWQAPSAAEATTIPNNALIPYQREAITAYQDVRLVTTPQEELGALWRQFDAPDDPTQVSLRWSFLADGAWTKPVDIATSPYQQPTNEQHIPAYDLWNPDVSIDRSGILHVTWTYLHSGARDQYLRGRYALETVGIPGDQAYAHETCGEIAVASKCVRAFQGDPVDTFTGNFSHQHTDITIPTAGEPLELIRAYNSLATDQDSPFGFGWTHNYHARLMLPSMPGGEDGVAILAMPFGSQVRFAIQEDGRYQPFPGIYSQLTSNDDGGFVLTGRDQQVWRFDPAGRVIEQSDTNGHTIFFNYYGASTTGRACPDEGASAGHLCTVVDASGLRYLDFRYSNNRIDTVRDPLDRTISYTYSDKGDLDSASISDTNGDEVLEWYAYFEAAHKLSLVKQPGATLVQNEFDAIGRMDRQIIQASTEVTYTYEQTLDGRQTTVTQHGSDGTRDVIVDTYRADGTLKKQEHNGRLVKYVTFDESLGLSSTTNANGQTTLIESNAMGQPTRITNALEQVTEMTYDGRNRLTTITDPLRRTMRLTYDEQNMVRQIEQGLVDGAEAAATTTITTNVRYPDRNLVEELEDATGMVTHLTYNDAGDVTEMAQGYDTPDVTLTQREYDAVGRLIRETVAAETDIARTTALEYHPNDTVATSIENYADGVFDEAITDEDLPTTYAYQGQRLTRETYPDGTATVTDYDSGGRIESVVFDGDSSRNSFDPEYPDDNVGVYYAYDGLGRVESIRETGLLTGTFDTTFARGFESHYARTTHYAYDAWSRLITTTHNYQPDGPVDSSTNLQEGLRYDAVGNVIARRDALDRWTNTEYDALNRPITVTANVDDGDPTTGSSDTDLVTTMRYDAGGRLDRTIERYVDGSFDPAEPDADRITTYTYNTLDQLTRTITNRDDGDPTTGSSDTDLITTYAYDALGRPTETVDPLERRQVQQYDTLGRLRARIANYQNGQHDGDDAPDTDLVTKYTYNALSQISRVTDVTGLATAYRYDGMGRLSTEIHNYDAEGPTDHQTNLTTRYAYNTQGALTSEISPAGVATTYELDKMGRPTRVGKDSISVIFKYDGTGTLRAMRAGVQRWTVFQTDPLGRQTGQIVGYADGETTPEELDTDLTTRQVYDAGGRVVRQIDPNGRVTAYRYDAADRLTQVVNNLVDGTFDPAVTDADVPTNYAYDRAGNRLTNTDANEQIWQTAYDALGRPISMTDPLDRVATQRYDRGSRITRLTRPDSAVVNYRYDAADRLIQIGYPDPANPTETTNIDYTYRADGVRLTMTDATGQTDYGYDTVKRLTSVVQPGAGTIGYRYTADGSRDRVSYPDGPTLTYAYDANNLLSSVKEDGTNLAFYNYKPSGQVWYARQTEHRYDQAGRLQQKRNFSAGHTFTTTYDRAGRPIEQVEDISGPTPIDRTVTMTYDGLDRLTDVNDTAGNSYTYDAVGNRLSATANGQTTAYTYDEAHQIATANDTPFTYDANGRLTHDGDQTYRYDALDRLIGAGDTSYAYNGDGDLMAATPDAGDPTVYVQDVGQGLSQVLQTRAGDTTTDYYYGLERFAAVIDGATTTYHYDILGNLRQTRDVATAALQYDPWGSPEQGSPAPFGFTGELHDQGLVHLRARWYHPQHGTFTTTDPFPGIGNVPASQHPYQYALNSPMRFTDPSGEFVPALLGAIVAGAIMGGLVEYGGQMVEQHRTTGTIDWGAYCDEEIAIAMLGGGVAGGVGFLMGPWASAAFGGGLRGSLIAGALEGSLTDGAMQITINWASGRTWHHNLGWTLLGGGVAGSTGSGIRWWRRSTLPYDAELVVATNLKTSVPFGHNLVGIRRANHQKTDVFEQIMNVDAPPTFWQTLHGGQDTYVAKRRFRQGYSMHRIPVTAKQAEAAWQKAVALANQPSTGPYHILTNSCTSNCRIILEAGGLQPPRWVATPHMLDIWSAVQSWVRS